MAANVLTSRPRRCTRSHARYRHFLPLDAQPLPGPHEPELSHAIRRHRPLLRRFSPMALEGNHREIVGSKKKG